jgi:peptidyl-prolyl cis-trans isomerase B (cyclophilin B)
VRPAVLVTVLVLALAGCGGSDDDGGGETTEATPPTTTAQATTGGCSAVSAPTPKADGGQTAPTKPLDAATTYDLVVETNCGAFTIRLDQKKAPKTAASLVALAENGFFDGTTFHRVVPGFVIQGGDPTGTGTGGPGYQTVDPPPQSAAYTRGVVAMAKTGTEPPGTAGSQFFVVTGADAGLPPDYAIVGTVTDGMDSVEAIEALGVGDGPPSEPVVIDKVTVEES